MDDRAEVIRRLRKAGIDGSTPEWDDEALAAAAVEGALGGPAKHTLSGLVREAGASTGIARSVMQALGRPHPSRGERLFTDEDVELVRAHKELVEAGLPRDEMLAAARILSQGIAQTADALRHVVGNALLEPGVTTAGLGTRHVEAVDRFGPAVEKLLAFELRAHLRDRMRGAFVTEAERASGELADTDDVAVAFADLVDYTRLGEQLPPAALGDIAMQPAELSIPCVKRPAKMGQDRRRRGHVRLPECRPAAGFGGGPGLVRRGEGRALPAGARRRGVRRGHKPGGRLVRSAGQPRQPRHGGGQAGADPCDGRRGGALRRLRVQAPAAPRAAGISDRVRLCEVQAG
jgi:hypothetical protein